MCVCARACKCIIPYHITHTNNENYGQRKADADVDPQHSVWDVPHLWLTLSVVELLLKILLFPFQREKKL